MKLVCVCVYVRELRGVYGEGGKGLSGLRWEESPWKSDSVSLRSPSCRLLGLCCFSGGVWRRHTHTHAHTRTHTHAHARTNTTNVLDFTVELDTLAIVL